MNYPLLSEYCSAVKQAADNFDQLQHLRPVLDAQGSLIMSSGNFAVVFKMHDDQAGKDVAVKCFLKEQEGRAESYRLISQELSFTSSNFLTPIRYLEKELFVASNSTDEEEFPVVLMDWIEGETLDRYIVSHLNDTHALQMLSFQFSRLASWLMSQPFAHGDLKPDNILVRTDGSLALVDYDGMFVPAMEGQQARELGSPDFRHPLRTAGLFNDHIDDFALTVILLSLKVLSIRPSLWNDYAAADRLLFSAADYRDLGSCALLKVLPELFTDAELTRIYGLFLLAHANGELSAVSFRLMNLAFPEKCQKEEPSPLKRQVEAPLEISTKVTDQDRAEGVLDEWGVLYSKDGLRLLKGNKSLTVYTVREGTRVICDEAFYYCTSLKTLNLPAGLTSIGDAAFRLCTSLAALTLPVGLTSIGISAFSWCSSLETLNLPAGLTSIGANPFRGCDKLKLSNHSSHFKIQDDLLLSSDGSQLISYMGKGSSVTIPDCVRSIGDSAFSECNSLAALNLPDGLTSIGNNAFSECKSLETLNLPDGVKSIGANPFRGCDELKLSNHSSHFKIQNNLLLSSDGSLLISYMGKGSYVTIPDCVRSIGDSAFSECKSLKTLNLPAGVTSIGDSAFSECKSLKTLNLPAGVTSIGDSAFYYCNSLETLNLPAGVTSIGNSAFYYCNSLETMNLPDGVKSIGISAFSYCKSLKTLNLPAGVTSIGYSAFLACASLETLNLPAGVTSIGNSAFLACASLETLNLPDGVKSIGNSAFSRCNSLKTLNLPAGVTSIGNSAFSRCNSLETLYIPQGTESHFKQLLPSDYHSILRTQ